MADRIDRLSRRFRMPLDVPLPEPPTFQPPRENPMRAEREGAA